ncbi:MAG: hypothetical protein GXP55_22990 [Deltaproteobacteria bacterium]|nr:hypothetical protein [Deltaproteobacteria bacterium]
MSIDLPEKRLLFRFAPGTRAQRWDGSDAYRQGLSQQAGTKAADLCWWAGDAGGLLEVTNYGPHRRPRIEDLAREAGQKFRDSLSGMIWACKRDLAPRPKAEFVRRFIDPSRGEKLVLALWFEADRPADQEEAGFLKRSETSSAPGSSHASWSPIGSSSAVTEAVYPAWKRSSA